MGEECFRTGWLTLLAYRSRCSRVIHCPRGPRSVLRTLVRPPRRWVRFAAVGFGAAGAAGSAAAGEDRWPARAAQFEPAGLSPLKRGLAGSKASAISISQPFK